MFRLDMKSIRQSAKQQRLMANLAKPANVLGEADTKDVPAPEITQKHLELAKLAGIAISHQVSQQSPNLLAARLIAAAMRVCDHYGDDKKARAEMRADCLALDQTLQADMLAHFGHSYHAIEQRGLSNGLPTTQRTVSGQ